MRTSQKQRQQLNLRQKSYLATRALVLQQPLNDFDALIDRFAANSLLVEKRPLHAAAEGVWKGDLESFVDEREETPADVIVNELIDRNLVDERDIETARYVASDLDDHGFFPRTVRNYAASTGLDPAAVRRVLKAMNTLEPAGLGAADAPHAIALQVSRVLPTISVTECARILRAHSRSVSPGVIRVCLSKMRMPADTVTLQKVMAVIDPEPLWRLMPERPRTIIPDIVIEVNGSGGQLTCSVPLPAWTLGMDGAVLNSLEDPDLRKRVAREAGVVRWIDDAIAGRTIALTKLGNALIDLLAPYLSREADAPRRVSVEKLMQATGISRTTMVRALRGKYIQTPRGTMRLRMLVMDRWETKSDAARQAITLLLTSQANGKPLSDREIAEHVAVSGIRVSRRTVAKYRLSLGIPARYFRQR